MAVNKVVFGNEVKMDLTNDTVSAENLLEGETAHNRSGNPIVGTAKQGHSILNKLGTLLTQRSKLKFGGMLKTTDDGTNDITVVSDEAEEIEWSVWSTMTEAQRDAYSAGKKLDIVNAPWASGHVPVELIKTLWTNPNPTVAFAEQTITLASSDYDLLLVTYRSVTNHAFDFSCVVNKGCNAILSIASSTGSAPWNILRFMTRVTDTSYHFAEAAHVQPSGSTIENNCAVPLVIYGIKLSVTVDISKIIVDESTKAEKTDIATVESGSTASRAYSVGELVYVNGNLYKVITAIANGATFTVGTNIQSTNVSDKIKEMTESDGLHNLSVKSAVTVSEYLNYCKIGKLVIVNIGGISISDNSRLITEDMPIMRSRPTAVLNNNATSDVALVYGDINSNKLWFSGNNRENTTYYGQLVYITD